VTYYIVSEPTDDERWNMYLLYKLSFHKDKIVGVYYIPRIRYYGPVLKLDNASDLSDIVKQIDTNMFNVSLKMICMRCGWCCEKNCGAFMFEHEAESIELESWSNVRTVRLYNGEKVKIYYLDSGRYGRCIFYDSRNRRCIIHDRKPIICIVTYCARYAIDAEGNLYVREGRAINGIIRFKKVQTGYAHGRDKEHHNNNTSTT